MATGDPKFAERLLRHLEEIEDGRCSIDKAEIDAESDPASQATLRRLRALHNRQVRRGIERDRANQFLEAIIENIPDMIFVKDAKELRFVRFSRAGERLLGYPREAMLGKNDYDFFPADEADFFTAKDRDVLERGTLVDIEEEPIHTADGHRWLHTKKIPLPDPITGEPSFLLGISEDITERKSIAEKLKQRTTELERSNAALEKFAYVASHDLQEPLRTIASFVQLLERDYGGKLDADAHQYIQYAVDGAHRMQELIRGLLQYSRVQTDAKPLVATRLDDLFDTVLLDLRSSISDSGATVTRDDLPELSVDGAQVRQLFQNLVSNAIKFRRDEAPMVHVSVERVGDEWNIAIADNGIGFEIQYREQIFEMFRRLHGIGEFPGTGIGLAICKKIVERHGGGLNVESAPGEGTTFTVTLPAAPSQ